MTMRTKAVRAVHGSMDENRPFPTRRVNVRAIDFESAYGTRGEFDWAMTHAAG